MVLILLAILAVCLLLSYFSLTVAVQSFIREFPEDPTMLPHQIHSLNFLKKFSRGLFVFNFVVVLLGIGAVTGLFYIF